MSNHSALQFSDSLPLRGSVQLQSSPELTLVLVAFMFLTDTSVRLHGSFNSNVVRDFIDLLNQHGFKSVVESDFIDVLEYDSVGESSFSSKINLSTALVIVLLLAKRGTVNVGDDKELFNFYKYLGLVVEEKDQYSQITNKSTKPLSSITFHTNNELYFYIALFSLYLNNEKFDISCPDLTYEQGLLIDLLKNLGFVEKVEYGEYTKIFFDFSNIAANENVRRLKVPNDPKEFVFYCSAAIVTGGEIEIVGLDPKFFASTLKIYSQLKVGFESKSEDVIKLWGSRQPVEGTIVVPDDGNHLEFTKVLLLPYITTVNSNTTKYIQIGIETDYYKSLLQDINRLGGELVFDSKKVVSKTTANYKSGVLHMESGVMISKNYSRLLLALMSSSPVKEFTNLSYYNGAIIKNLNNLGAGIYE